LTDKLNTLITLVGTEINSMVDKKLDEVNPNAKPSEIISAVYGVTLQFISELTSRTLEINKQMWEAREKTK